LCRDDAAAHQSEWPMHTPLVWLTMHSAHADTLAAVTLQALWRGRSARKALRRLGQAAVARWGALCGGLVRQEIRRRGRQYQAQAQAQADARRAEAAAPKPPPAAQKSKEEEATPSPATPTSPKIAAPPMPAAAVEALAAEARNTALLASLKASPLLRLRPVVEEPPPSEEAEGGSVTDSAVDEDQVSTGDTTACQRLSSPAALLTSISAASQARALIRIRSSRSWRPSR